MGIINHTLNDHATALADYLPDGPLFEAKNISGSNLRDLLNGISGELKTAEGHLKTLSDEYNPMTTTAFLDEWERAVGIPDDCFSIASTDDERRLNILTKIAALGVQTEQDFIDLASIFGKTVTVTYGESELFPPYNLPFTPGSLPEARFVIIITGDNIVTIGPPYNVPFNLFDSETTMQCLMNMVKPANVKLIFRNN